MYVTLILLGGGVFLTLGDIVFKYWLGAQGTLLYILGLALYIVGLLFLVASYTSENIAVASALLVLFNISILAFVSWLYFKEPPSFVQILGLIFAAIAILLLEIGS